MKGTELCFTCGTSHNTLSALTVVHLALRSYCKSLHWTSLGFYNPPKPIILKPKLSLNQQERESCADSRFAQWWKIIVIILMLLWTCKRPQQFAGVSPVRVQGTCSLAHMNPRAHTNAQAQQYWQRGCTDVGFTCNITHVWKCNNARATTYCQMLHTFVQILTTSKLKKKSS